MAAPGCRYINCVRRRRSGPGCAGSTAGGGFNERVRRGVPNSLALHLSARSPSPLVSLFFHVSHISAGGSRAMLNEVCKKRL